MIENPFATLTRCGYLILSSKKRFDGHSVVLSECRHILCVAHLSPDGDILHSKCFLWGTKLTERQVKRDAHKCYSSWKDKLLRKTDDFEDIPNIEYTYK